MAEETLRTLGRLVAQHERIDFEGDQFLADKLAAFPGVASVDRSADGSFRVHLDEESAIPAALSLLVASGVTSIRTSRPSLEEVYVHIIGDRGLKV